MPERLATSMIRAATSRTCPTLPGAPVSSRACSVWTESITQASGRSASSVGEHGVEVGLGQHGHVERAGAARRRSARRRICAADSSPVT